jgi:predicted acetyltransferase
MSLEFRPAEPKEMREFFYSGRLGFGRSVAVDEVDRDLQDPLILPERTLCAFDDQVLAAKMVTLPLKLYWNGPIIDCGGVTAVSTLPSHRRRGYVGELLRRSFAAMRDAGQPVSLLWASMAAIYQRFGYGLAFASHSCRFDARRVTFVDEIDCSGGIRILDSSDAVANVDGAYACFAAQRTTALQHDDAWRARLSRELLRPRGDTSNGPLLVATYEEAGAVRGYVVYGIERAGPGRPAQRDDRITVHELVWLNPAAHRALVRYIAAYDLVGTVWFRLLAADDPLFYHVEDPRMLGLGLSDGAMLRIIDVRQALEGRGYGADGALVFGMQDELCPWNDGVWELTTDGGRGTLQRSTREPELVLLPRVLSMLATGFQPATCLARMGLIAATDTHALDLADQLFKTPCPPLCLDHF